MIALASWLLLTIGYDHTVRTSTWPTEEACWAAVSPRLSEVRDSFCRPIPEAKK